YSCQAILTHSFFCNPPGTTKTSTLPLHDALPIYFPGFGESPLPPTAWGTADYADAVAEWLGGLAPARCIWIGHSFGSRVGLRLRSEEHTSELQSLRHIVCRLLLEKINRLNPTTTV